MILNRQRSVRLPVRALEVFLRRVRRELRLGKTHITVCLVSDAEIAGMNEQFRKKQGPTDVLSFPAVQRRGPLRSRANRDALNSLPPEGTRAQRKSPCRTNPRVGYPEEKERSLGDIAIAPAVAKRNAQNYGRSFPTELKILILHGALHLLGYDHEADRGEMGRTEKQLRRRLGLA